MPLALLDKFLLRKSLPSTSMPWLFRKASLFICAAINIIIGMGGLGKRTKEAEGVGEMVEGAYFLQEYQYIKQYKLSQSMATEVQAVDYETALKRIIQTSNSDSLLAKGVHEVCKSLESKDEKVHAKYVILAKNCTEANYIKIVKGLAAQNKVPVIEIEAGETLGEWLGICKRDKNGNVTKKRKCSSVAIRDFSADVKEEEKKIFLAKLG